MIIIKINWQNSLVHINKDSYTLLFVSSKIYKKINSTEYEIINYIIKNKVDVNLTNSKYTDLFSSHSDAEYINNYINLLIKMGIIIQDNINGLNSKIRINSLCIILTNKCNLKCRHCCQNAGFSIGNEFNQEEWYRAIDILHNNFEFENIMISGGEPLILNDFFDIVSYMKKRIKGTYTLMTNGILINESNIKFIGEYYDHISLSLDGIDSETTNIVRGEDIFDKVIEKIDMLHRENINNISLSAVLPRSLEVQNKFKELCSNLNVSPLIRELSLTGRGEENLKFLNDEYNKFLNKNSYSKYNEGEREYLGNLKKCGAGKTIITISPDGSIYPCNLLQEEFLKIGNIFESDIKDKVYNYDIHKKIREKIKIECLNCEYEYLCWTCYSKYLSYVDKENLFLPRCKLRKDKINKYIEGIDEL